MLMLCGGVPETLLSTLPVRARRALGARAGDDSVSILVHARELALALAATREGGAEAPNRARKLEQLLEVLGAVEPAPTRDGETGKNGDSVRVRRVRGRRSDAAPSERNPLLPDLSQPADDFDDGAPPPPPDETLHTQQTCYISSDEAELCVYDGPLCFDGTGAVVLTDQQTEGRAGSPLYVVDYSEG